MLIYPNAAKGVKTMYIAEIISIVAIVIAAAAAFASVVEIVASLIGIAAAVFSLIGIMTLAKDSPEVKTAIILEIAAIVVSIIFLILNATGVYNDGDGMGISDLVNGIIDLLVLYFVLKGIRNLCDKVGAPEVSDYGKRTWVVNIASLIIVSISTVILIVLFILALASDVENAATEAVAAGVIVGVISALAAVAGAIMQLAASIMYIVLLGKASKALNAAKAETVVEDNPFPL